ncbi:MAG: virulence protein SciE type [Burkholderiales bacterium]|nr:virulence protein SciE type [Burkholderiales bacterium]
MQLADLLREARLDEALAELQSQVRRTPSDAKLRVLLFQLLAVMGQWDRAANQLSVIADLDAKALAMVQTYRAALDCEVFRDSVFAGNKTPLVFGDPADWIARLIEALRHTAQGRHADAERLRADALEQAAAVSGQIDGQAFAWIADADSRLGPVCEAIINGKYYWVPFERLHAIQVDAPEDLRDVVWMPVRLTFANGGETVALIPTRYPGSEKHAEGAIRLARKTDWMQTSDATYLGAGQRMFATDTGEYPLMDVRRIRIGEALRAGEADNAASGEA